jgi:hypothetical protein
MPGQVYEVRVNGLVPTEGLLDELVDVDVAGHELRTVVRGSFRDQAALYAFLHRLRAYGLEVVEVHRVSAPVPTDSPAPPAPPAGHDVGGRP